MATVDGAASLSALSREVIALDSYAPSARVNGLLRQLVDRVLSGDGQIDLGRVEVGDLRAACANAEFQLERHWSQRVATAQDPWAELQRFPYLGNYRTLTRMEHEGVDHTEGPNNAVFVGGGPLPLSALLLAAEHDCEVTVVDHDPAAIAEARALIDALAVDVTVRERDGAAVAYHDYDRINVAALVGLGGAPRVFERIRETADSGTPLLTRTVHGRRTVLYPPLPDSVYELFDHRETVRPPRDVINSVVLLKL